MMLEGPRWQGLMNSGALYGMQSANVLARGQSVGRGICGFLLGSPSSFLFISYLANRPRATRSGHQFAYVNRLAAIHAPQIATLVSFISLQGEPDASGLSN